MSFILQAGGIDLPAPTSISANDELIWSSDTGRTLTGKMIGNVVAEKKNVSIKWSMLTEGEVAKIKKNLVRGSFPFRFRDNGETITINAYRGTISKEQLGDIGDGNFYYKSVSVDIIQR